MLEDKEDKGIPVPFCVLCNSPWIRKQDFPTQETWIRYLKHGWCNECQMTQDEYYNPAAE